MVNKLINAYTCTVCDKDFGNRKSNYVKHCNSKKHLQKVNQQPKNEIIRKKILKPVKDSKDEQIENLTNMVMMLKEQLEEIKNTPSSPRTRSPILAAVPRNRNTYSIAELLNRNDTDLPNPLELNWKKFITDGYYYKEGKVDKIIASNYSAVAHAANLLLAKIKSTKKIHLPILVINKQRGSARKIAYYSQKYNEFIVKTDIEKKTDVELYQFLETYLGRSAGQYWLIKKLKAIYNELPIEIRDKMYFERTKGDNKLCFLNLYCTCEDGDHTDCYKASAAYDPMTGKHFYKYKDSELIKPDGHTFSLNGDEFTNFIQEYYDHIEEHEYCDVYKSYRKTQDEMTCIWASEDNDLKMATNELFDKVSELCNINPLLELRK